MLTQDSPPSWCKSIKPLIQLLNHTKVHLTLFCVVCYRRKCNPMEKVEKNVLFICFKIVTPRIMSFWSCSWCDLAHHFAACFVWQSMHNSFRLNIHLLVMNLYGFSAIHIYVHLLYLWNCSCESVTIFSQHMGPTSGNTQLMEPPQESS